jgi:integrase
VRIKAPLLYTACGQHVIHNQKKGKAINLSIYRRKSGKWAVRIDLDRGFDGKRLRRNLGTYHTYKEAERAERAALEARDRGIDLVPSATTVAELGERFFRDIAPRWADKTRQRADGLWKHNILPHVGGLTVARIKPAHIAELYSTLREKGRADGKGGLSGRSVLHVHRLLHRMFGWAERMQLVGRNVIRSVEAPKVEATEARALTEDEVLRLLDATEGTGWHTYFLLGVATGARRGELCALHWSDVSFDDSVATIRASLSQSKYGIALKTTKTERIRVVPLTAEAIEALRKHRARQAAEKLASGAAYDDRGFIFADPLGSPIPPQRFTQAFDYYARKVALPTRKLHALRHTAASWMLGGGIDVRTTATVLGHSAPSTTANIYAHTLPGAQERAVAALAERLGAARKRAAAKAQGHQMVTEAGSSAS